MKAHRYMNSIHQFSLYRKLQNIFHPERFQGWGKEKRYFEGWYFKVVNKDASKAFAFIPGIAIDENSNAQAFIQVLDGIKKTSTYHRFDANLFKPSSNSFHVELAGNIFNYNTIQLNLPDAHGALTFKEQFPWPKSIFSPGIMGPFTFVPFMECYHGIVSMDHCIEGTLTINKEVVDMHGGRGYIEKDWGHSFPSAYIWMQSNHFSIPGISFKSSVANIPWLGSSFVGFIAGLTYNGNLIQFTTYNRSVLQKCYADQNEVVLILQNKKHRLEIKAIRDHATELASPIMGLMDGKIEESMTSSVEICLTDVRTQKILLQEKSDHTAIEVAGNISLIMK